MEATFQDFPLLGVAEPADQIVDVIEDKDDIYKDGINPTPGDVYDVNADIPEDGSDVTEDEDDVYAVTEDEDDVYDVTEDEENIYDVTDDEDDVYGATEDKDDVYDVKENIIPAEDEVQTDGDNLTGQFIP